MKFFSSFTGNVQFWYDYPLGMIGDILGRQKRSRLFAFCLPGLSSLNPYIWSSFIIKSSNNLASTGRSRPFFEQSIFIDNKFYIFTFCFILFTIFFDQKKQIKSAFHFSFDSCAAFLYTCANGLKIIYRGHIVVKLIIWIYRQNYCRGFKIFTSSLFPENLWLKKSGKLSWTKVFI